MSNTAIKTKRAPEVQFNVCIDGVRSTKTKSGRAFDSGRNLPHSERLAAASHIVVCACIVAAGLPSSPSHSGKHEWPSYIRNPEILSFAVTIYWNRFIKRSSLRILGRCFVLVAAACLDPPADRPLADRSPSDAAAGAICLYASRMGWQANACVSLPAKFRL
jgi:hypothetical protein